MYLNLVLVSGIFSLINAAHLSLNGGNIGKFACGSGCLVDLDCSQSSVDAFSACIAENCDKEDVSVAHGVEKFMTKCHSFAQQEVDIRSLDTLKSLYVSSQMAIMKRQADAMASNGTAGNGTNGTNSTGGTGTTGGEASPTQTGTYATGCTDIAGVVNGACVVRGSSDAGALVRNTALVLLSVAALTIFSL